MTRTPTAMVSGLVGTRPVNLAAIGAATTPPIASPSAGRQSNAVRVRPKVAVMATVTKNSAAFTDPMVVRGESPRARREAVTIGPQPPPKASQKPPARPRDVRPAGFGDALRLKRTRAPRISR